MLRWIVDYEEALTCWEQFCQIAPLKTQHPYAHPGYVWLAIPNTQPSIVFWQTRRLSVWYPVIITPLPEATGLSGIDLTSPYGLGGPILIGDLAALPAFWDAWKLFCEQQQVFIEFVRFHPLLQNYRPMQAHYQPISQRTSIWVDLTVDDLYAECQPAKRRDLRQAEGFDHQLSEDLSYWNAFINCYMASMREKQADTLYYFSDTYFAGLKQFIANGHAWLMSIIAKHGDYLGGAIFLTGGEQVYYHLACVSTLGRTQQASNWFVWQSLLKAKRLGYRQGFLGGGMQESDSLQQFKARFSSRQASYVIAVHIHRQQEYETLKQRYGAKAANNRIMFYR